MAESNDTCDHKKFMRKHVEFVSIASILSYEYLENVAKERTLDRLRWEKEEVETKKLEYVPLLKNTVFIMEKEDQPRNKYIKSREKVRERDGLEKEKECCVMEYCHRQFDFHRNDTNWTCTPRGNSKGCHAHGDKEHHHGIYKCECDQGHTTSSTLTDVL